MFQNSKFKIQNSNKGFTIIESVVGVGIFLLIFLTIFSLFGAVFGTIRNNKARIAANSIAPEQLEIIRGMDFSAVAMESWAPAGPLKSQKTATMAGVNFTVRTDVAFFDDPYDSLDESNSAHIDPPDAFSLDYKKVRIRVSWTNFISKTEETVAMSTTIVPPGREGLDTDKGGILVTVFNAAGVPIFDLINPVAITITNSAKSYSFSGTTDLNGNLWVSNLEPSSVAPAGNYHIVATKSGFSVDQTYAVNDNPASPDYNPIPIKPDVIVVGGEAKKVGLSIDVLGNLNIQTVNYSNPQNWVINESGIGAKSQTEIDLDIDDNNNIFLVWRDDRDGPVRLYAQKYAYNPSTLKYDKQWMNDLQITTANNKGTPRMAVSGTTYFYIVGADDRNGNKDVFVEKYNSSDSSFVWNGIKANLESGSTDQIKPDIAVDSLDNFYVAWMDNRNGNQDIYIQKRNSVGTALWGSDVKVNNDTTFLDQINPKVIVDNENNLYVIWEDNRNGDKDIYWAKFDPSGTKLMNDKKVNNDGGFLDQYEPAIAFDGSDYFYISWSDKRNSQPDIYAQKYDKNGNVAASGNWSNEGDPPTPTDIKVNDDSLPNAWRMDSSVAYSPDGIIYFSWEDDRNGNPDVYSTKFDSDGNKLWNYDLIMNGASAGTQSNPEVVADSMGYGITVWEDDRNGDFDIYAARYKNLGFYARTSIPITITGVKLKGNKADGSPIYKYSKTFNSDTNGEVHVGIDFGSFTEVEWDNYSFSATAPHIIVSTDQSEPLAINPGETKDVVINVEP